MANMSITGKTIHLRARVPHNVETIGTVLSTFLMKVINEQQYTAVLLRTNKTGVTTVSNQKSKEN